MCRQAAFSQEPQRITKDEKLWNARDTFTKAQGDARDFGAQIQAPNGAELLQARVAPILRLAALLRALSLIHSLPIGEFMEQGYAWCLRHEGEIRGQMR